MKHTERWVEAHTTPQGREYVSHLKSTISGLAVENNTLRGKVEVAEGQVQNLDREVTRLKRELAEARSGGH